MLHEAASSASCDTFVVVKRSAADLYEGPDPKVAHLSLCGPQSDHLIQNAARVLKEDGYHSLVIGQDNDHFLPGAPTDLPWIADAAKRCGFLPGDLTFDLERDLENLSESAQSTQGECRMCRSGDLPKLEAFFAREFPGRWSYDIKRKIRADGTESVYGLFCEGECEGFALLQNEGCALPIGGAVWHLDLGEAWAALGPIGISRHLRGAGLGRAFLDHALVELRRRGARQTIIDWTSLVDYYGTQGFSINRAYRSYRLSLRADR